MGARTAIERGFRARTPARRDRPLNDGSRKRVVPARLSYRSFNNSDGSVRSSIGIIDNNGSSGNNDGGVVKIYSS